MRVDFSVTGKDRPSKPKGCSSCRHGRRDATRMKFYVSCAFLKTGEVLEIARAADDLGYEGLGIPDHVVNLETLATPYPYTDDGERRWQPFTDWPDPWVLVGALATGHRAAEVPHHRLHPGDARPVLGGEGHRYCCLPGRRPGRTRHRRGLVRRGVHLDGPAVRQARQANRRDDRADAGAVAARLDGVRRRVLPDPAAGDDADASTHPDLQRGSVGYRVATRGGPRRLDR